MFAAPDFFTAVLWGLAASAALLTCLPMLLALLGLTRVEFIPTGGPEAAEPAGDDACYADLYDRLRELGFEPLGSRVEVAWFFMWYWRRRGLPGLVLVRPGSGCAASLYRLYRGDPWRLSFATVLTDGTLISTANQIERLRIDRPGYYRRGYVTQDLGELLRLHEEAVADFRARDGEIAHLNLNEYCEVAARRTEEHLRAGGRRQAFHALQTDLFVMGGCAVAAAFWQGVFHWAVPVAVMVGAAAFRLLMPLTIRLGARRISRQEQEGALASHWASARRRRRWEQAAQDAGPDEGVYPADQRPRPSDAIRADPPPLPPTDITRPPGA